ncbi:hypothetical protein BGZ65_002605 [Modicella reniformis]|uniref:FAD-binding domain-containing protein n=1 Tax=Modicella reniformis TaxID=1440133 RepID=A0A9P6LS54_9FUNG|nr:hypothetical protein BGZ65_002605 [Modicella reniformis]
MSTTPLFNGTTNPLKPEVAIVGAGIGGLLLGLLLEQIDVPYHIYERATTVKPLGSAMSLGASVLPIFEQLGMLEELKSFSLPCYSAEVYNEKIERLGCFDMSDLDKLLGTYNRIFARPRLYEMMLNRIPIQKISHGKKVLRTDEKDGRVHIHCADNTSYEADILVGADGAYSGVRRSLYKRLDEQGVLPETDLENFTIASINMVGVADPEEPEKYPQLKDEFCHFSIVVGGSGGLSWGAVSVPDNQICWSLVIQLSDSDAKAMQFRNSEWAPESIEAMYKQFEDVRCPWGPVTLGEVMKHTPKDRISKVFLEEKLFTTWYGGHTVLLGDACHKMLPGAGLGAVNAMHDAVVLANAIYNMTDASPTSITGAFEEYYGQRFHRLDDQIKRSKSLTAVMGGEDQNFIKSVEYRPQVAWLPLIPNRGTGHVLAQEGQRELLADKHKRLQEEEQQQDNSVILSQAKAV